MKTLLTGASGYIGLHLVKELLNQGHQVTAIARSIEKLGPFLENKNFVLKKLDLENSDWYEDVLSGHDCCIHLALIWGDETLELEGHDTSVTAKFFEAAGTAKVKRAIYISSTAVHRSSTGDIGEDHSFTTKEIYGATKAAGELFFRSACARHKMTGIVVRPGPVVGSPAYEEGSIRSPRTFEKFIDLASKNQPISIRENSKIQFCNVHVLADMIAMLTRVQKPHDTYFCVGEEAFLWQDIASYIVKELQSKSKIVKEKNPPVASPLYFKTDRLRSLLGEVPGSKSAIYDHINYLIKIMKNTRNNR